MTHLFGACSKFKELQFPYFSTDYFHSWLKVKGFSDPGPFFLMRMGSYFLKSVVQRKLRSGQVESKLLRIWLRPSVEI